MSIVMFTILTKVLCFWSELSDIAELPHFDPQAHFASHSQTELPTLDSESLTPSVRTWLISGMMNTTWSYPERAYRAQLGASVRRARMMRTGDNGMETLKLCDCAMTLQIAGDSAGNWSQHAAHPAKTCCVWDMQTLAPQ